MDEKYFFFGFGQVGRYYINYLFKKKTKFSFNISTTSGTKSKKLNNKNYFSLKFNGQKFDKKISKILKSTSYILISIPPDTKGDLVLRNFKKDLKSKNIKKIIYLSATNVYGDHKGRWVNEKSKCNPTSKQGKNRLRAEKQWTVFCKKNKLNLNILRIAGIYSRESNAIKRLKLGPKVFVRKKNHFFSRIRIEDIAQVIHKVFKNKSIKYETFNVADDLPASSEILNKYAAKILKIRNLKQIGVKDLKGKMIKNFYKDSKKIKNSKMKRVLKVSLKYSNYKKGLRDLRY